MICLKFVKYNLYLHTSNDLQRTHADIYIYIYILMYFAKYIPYEGINYILHIYIYIYIYYVELPGWISMNLFHPPSQSPIAPARSSKLNPVAAQNYSIEVLAGRTAFTRPCEGVHQRISLISSSLLLHQYHAYVVRLTLIIFVMGSKWPSSCCFLECFLQYLFNIVRSILV